MTGKQGPPGIGQAVAELGMHGAQGLGVEAAMALHRGVLAGQQQVQQGFPLPKGLQGVAQQKRQQRKLHHHITVMVSLKAP